MCYAGSSCQPYWLPADWYLWGWICMFNFYISFHYSCAWESIFHMNVGFWLVWLLFLGEFADWKWEHQGWSEAPNWWQFADPGWFLVAFFFWGQSLHLKFSWGSTLLLLNHLSVLWNIWVLNLYYMLLCSTCFLFWWLNLGAFLLWNLWG